MTAIVSVFALLTTSSLGAQAPAGPSPCHQVPCALVVDWGVGKSSIDMPPDRRYGSAPEFEASLKAALQSHDMLAVTSAPDSKVTIRIEAKYATRVLCDDMPGTAPDRSCATIGEAVANFSTSEAGAQLPTSVRMINRCGASGAMMTMKQFGKYSADMIWYALEGERAKATKPMGKC